MRTPIESDGLKHGEAEREDQENDGNRCPIARPQKGEALLHHGIKQHFGCLGWPAFSEHSDRIKDLKAADGRDGDDEYKGGTKHGPSHATKAFPGAIGTVHGKRLIKILRDRLQPCHEKDHRKAKILPDTNRNEGEKRRIRILQPISGGQAQGPEKLIDEANGRVEHEFPDQRHGEQR